MKLLLQDIEFWQIREYGLLMAHSNELTLEVTAFTKDILTSPSHKKWRDGLSKQKRNRWYTLVVELDKADCPIEKLTEFGEDIFSVLVYRCIPAPNYNDTGELLVLFHLADWIWHSLIYYTPPLDH